MDMLAIWENLRKPEPITYLCRPGLGRCHFDGKDSSLRTAFDRVLAVLAPLGPVEVLAERSRIALPARMSFAAFTPRRHWLGGHLVLARKADHPLFRKVEVYSAHHVLHAFRLTTPSDVDNAFAALLVEAYGVGRQEHVRR